MKPKLFIVSISAIVCAVSGMCQNNVQDVVFNKSILNFKYATNLNGKDIYVTDEKKDPSSKGSESTYAWSIEDDCTYEYEKGFFNYLREREVKSGNTVEGVTTKDTTLNGLKVFEMSLYETYKGKMGKTHHFFAFIHKGNHALVFWGTDADKEKYYTKMRKTFYSVKWQG